MGEVIRGTPAGNAFPLTAGPFLLIASSCGATFAVTYHVLNRRG